MVIRTCDICGKKFESEGHQMGEWLNLCHGCNIRKGNQGDLLWSNRKLNKLYKEIRRLMK